MRYGQRRKHLILVFKFENLVTLIERILFTSHATFGKIMVIAVSICINYVFKEIYHNYGHET